jgi:hypothetical protein
VHCESEIPKYRIGPAAPRGSPGPIRYFGISDSQCRIRPISKFPVCADSVVSRHYFAQTGWLIQRRIFDPPPRRFERVKKLPMVNDQLSVVIGGCASRNIFLKMPRRRRIRK